MADFVSITIEYSKIIDQEIHFDHLYCLDIVIMNLLIPSIITNIPSFDSQLKLMLLLFSVVFALLSLIASNVSLNQCLALD